MGRRTRVSVSKVETAVEADHDGSMELENIFDEGPDESSDGKSYCEGSGGSIANETGAKEQPSRDSNNVNAKDVCNNANDKEDSKGDQDDGVEKIVDKEVIVSSQSSKTPSETDEYAKTDLETEESTVNENGDSIEIEDNVTGDAKADNDSNEGEEELWDLKVVFAAKEIAKAKPIMCSTEGCNLVACCVWASNLDPESPWYNCLDCQENDFGGWPEDQTELPLKILTDEHRKIIIKRCTNQEDPIMPDLPACADDSKKSTEDAATSMTNNSKEAKDAKVQGAENETNHVNKEGDNENANGDKDADETWDLQFIFSVKDLTKSKPVMCSHDDCNLVACSKWVSNLNPENSWFTCIDCQEQDFAGWPEEHSELPVKFLTEENKKIMSEKCSRQKEPAMPNLPTCFPLLTTAANSNKIPAITPPPSHEQAVTESESNVVVGIIRAGIENHKKKTSVTPSPMLPTGAAKQEVNRAPSKGALVIHQKWQAEAERQGGPDARIVVSKPAAKKLIFDVLFDTFCPMNITEIHQVIRRISKPFVIFFIFITQDSV